jgi:hypothetical protein
MARDLSHARWQTLRDLSLAMVGNSEFCRVSAKIEDWFSQKAGKPSFGPWGRRLINEIGCTSAEADQFNAMMWARWMSREQNIVFISDLTPGQRMQFDQSIRNGYRSSSPDGAWYEEYKSNLNPDAVKYIDNLLAQPG